MARAKMEKENKVHIQWFGEHITPYWNTFYRHLAQRSGIDLFVHHRVGIPSTHPWKFEVDMGYRNRNFLRPLVVPDFPSIRSVVTGHNTLFFFVGTKGLTKVLLLLTVILFNRRFVYFTDTLPGDYLGGIKGIFVRRIILFLVFRYAERVLSTGSVGVRQLLKFGCPESKTVNFPFFIDIPPLNGTATGAKIKRGSWKNFIRPGDMVFLASGQLIERKGFDIIIRAFRNYLNRNRRKNLKLLIAGDGVLKDELRKRVKELDLEQYVAFLGWVQPDLLDDFYATGDVFVHMARFDPYPVVVLEAMARKLTVIGSDMTMVVRDRIIHGENGFMIKTDDVEALAETIKFCMERKEDVIKMGEAARKTAESWPMSKGVKIIEDIVKL